MKSIEILAQPLAPVVPLRAHNNHGQAQDIYLVREQPLTIYLNRIEIVTLMTMGTEPAYLIAGFLLNQHLIEEIDDITSIHVDWTVNAAAVVAKNVHYVQEKTQQRVVTTGCGQGTMFSAVMEKVRAQVRDLPPLPPLTAEKIYALLRQLNDKNSVYRQAGAVHGCALCSDTQVIKVIEDVGRHNAVDGLSGFLALETPAHPPTIMYTTGRLTSEMVIKTAQM